jgi:hypothetical protein
MGNYNNEQLSILASNTTEFHSLLKESSNWVKRNLELDEKDILLNELQETKSEISVLNESILTKPVFALFGISQVGKSYLVKNLLSVDGKSLEIELPNKEKIDFLQSINPKGGGTESTGVVSRFTIDANFSNPEFPFQVKLLDVKDLVLILCDSFFSDIMKLDYYPTVEDFNKHVAEFKQIALKSETVQHDLTEDDIYYLKKYFETYLERISPMANHVTKSSFWLEIAQIIDRIDSSKWVALFGILWTHDSHFSFLFEKLITGLKSLSYSKEVHVAKSAILRDQGKILDVVRVNGIFKPEELTKVLLPTNQLIDFDLFMLSALTAEIAMPVSQEVAEQKAFLKNTDLLDFPGARSRKPFEKEQIQREMTPELLLRGKISYLFNKYSSNYEINNLLFCIKNWNNEVKEIPLLINDWIKRNVGETSEKREKRIGKNGTNPLFVILTFYNQTMEYNPNSDQDDLSEKWDKRFIRLFKEETVTKANDWDENWTTSEPNFKSFYPLRDFQFSTDVFSGYVNENKETGINSDRIEYYYRLKESFLNFPYIKSHLENPLDAWESCSTPNQDGSSRIIRDLEPAANNSIKTKNYINQLAEFKETIIEHLKKHYKSDDISEQRDKAIAEGIRIQNALKDLFDSGSKFGEFLTKLYLSNTEIYNFIHENYLPAANNHNPTKEEVIIRTYDLELSKGFEENKQILMEKLMLPSISEVDNWLEKEGISLEKVLQNVHVTAASILVDGVIDIWKKRLDADNFKDYSSQGLDLSVIKTINDNLIQTFEIFEVRKELIYLFEKKTRLLKVSNDTDEYLASIITSYINDFVSNFGFNFMKDERKNQVMELARSKNMNIDSLMATSRQVSEKNLCDLFEEDDSSNSLVVTYPAINHFKSFMVKIQLILLSNCGFRKYNVEENRILEELINRIENLHVEIKES